jgi:hypothetical protein
MQRDVQLFSSLWKVKYNSKQQPQRSSNTYNKTCLVDFVHIYFRRRFPGDETLQLEWRYNLAASCRRFKFVADISRFWNILSGDLVLLI